MLFISEIPQKVGELNAV